MPLELVTGRLVLLLLGRVQCFRPERVTGGVLIAGMLEGVLGPSSLDRKDTAILQAGRCHVTEVYLEKAPRLAIKSSQGRAT